MQVLESVESSTAAGAQAQAQSESEKIAAQGVSSDNNKIGGSKNSGGKNGVATISNNDDNSRVSRLD